MNEHLIENDTISDRGEKAQGGITGIYGRRGLMLGAAAGVGAVASLAGEDSASAQNSTPVELGDSNSATATTEVTTSSGSGLYGISVGASGITGNTAGVLGDSNTNDGVVGLSSAGDGVGGQTSADGYRGVYGGDDSTGGGYGVQGESVYGVGVQGFSYVGTGIYAEGGTGAALQVAGRAVFSLSGVISIAAGKKSATASAAPLTASSLVLANLQNSLPGVYVEAVVPNPSRLKITIYLSKAVPSGETAKVGWFVVN